MAWSRLILCVVSRSYRAFFLTLVVAAIVPTLWSWTGYVVRSGSMEPSIDVGDVVVAKPFSDAEQIPLGRVLIFADPAEPDGHELLVHRVVESLGQGAYATQGDANATQDVTPITADDVESRAVLLIPLVGRPLVWLEHDQYALFSLWTALTCLAFVFARRPGGKRKRPGARGPTAAVVVVASGLALSGTTTATAAYTAHTTSGSNTWTVAVAAVPQYTSRVLADNPYVYYQLDEASGSAMADSSGNARNGTYAAIAGYAQAGALPNNPGTAVRLAGLTGRLVSGGPAVPDPLTYSLELWFKTTTTTGGKLIGFESTRNALSPTFDRHVFMRPDGRLVYGGWVSPNSATLVSPAAYNNGGWHHLVVTARPHGQQQDSVMYVDGNAVASGTTTRTAFYSGWWRVGYGSLGTGAGYPVSANFSGTIDQVAVYHSELTAGRVQSHWAAR
jgi:signal peptidase I